MVKILIILLSLICYSSFTLSVFHIEGSTLSSACKKTAAEHLGRESVHPFSSVLSKLKPVLKISEFKFDSLIVHHFFDSTWAQGLIKGYYYFSYATSGAQIFNEISQKHS